MNNKYKIKIVQEDGMFVGYCLQNDEVIGKTAPCKDSTSASRNLSILMGRLETSSSSSVTIQKSPGPSVIKSTPPAAVPVSYTASKPPQPSAPRRCCGRG